MNFCNDFTMEENLHYQIKINFLFSHNISENRLNWNIKFFYFTLFYIK